MAGEYGLLGDLQGFMGQFGPTEEDRRSARQQAIIMAGLGMLGARKGNLPQDLSRAAVGGVMDYNQQMRDIPQQKMASLQAAHGALGLQDMMRKMSESDQARKIAMGAAQGQVPGQQAAAPMGPPTPAGEMSQPSLPQQASGTNKRALSDYYAGLAQKFQAAGLVDQANQANEQAVKYLPKLKDTKTLTQNGKRITVNFYEDGTQEVIPFGPDQEKAHFLDVGNKVGAVDPFSGQPIAGGGMYNKTVTPGEQLSSDTTRRGQNMTDQRARDSLAQGNKPQIVTDNNGNFFAIDPRSAQGTQVTDTKGGALNKGDKPLTEVQGNATAFGMRMAAANGIINKLEDTGFDTGKASNLLASNRVTNYAASPEAQELHQAKLNFMSASLRKESGAAISQSEYDMEDKKYFPQPGDSKATRDQKRAMRDLAMDAMAKQAGPGARQFSAGKGFDYAAVPKGATYTAPDGSKRVKQ